jgi:hypothetical protein
MMSPLTSGLDLSLQMIVKAAPFGHGSVGRAGLDLSLQMIVKAAPFGHGSVGRAGLDAVAPDDR